MAINRQTQEALGADVRRATAGSPARLRKSKVLRGCNEYAGNTVVRQRIEFGGLTGLMTGECGAEFAQQYSDLITELDRQMPLRRNTAGFRKELESEQGVPIESALFELILAIELAMRNTLRRYSELAFAEIVPAGSPGAFDFVWETAFPGLSRRAARAGVTALTEILPEPQQKLWSRPAKKSYEKQLAELRRRAIRRRWSRNLATLAMAADRRGFAYTAIGDAYLRVGQGSMQRIVHASSAGPDAAARRDARDGAHKYLERLASHDFPVAAPEDAAQTEGSGADMQRYRVVIVGGTTIAALEIRRRDGEAANDSEEFDYCDATRPICQTHRALVREAARCIGGEVVGIDLLTRDLGAPPEEAGTRIVAVTTQPDLLRHMLPDKGQARDIGGEILNRIFPPARSWDIPTAVIAGSRGTHAMARELDQILRLAGRAPGVFTRLGATVAGEPVNSGSRGMQSAYEFLVNDPRVEFLVNANSPRRIVGNGLYFGSCGVAAIVDPQPEDDQVTYWRGVKVVLSAATRCLVVNAASQCARMLQALIGDERLILVSTSSADEFLERHQASGGRVLMFTESDGDPAIEYRKGEELLAPFPVSPHLREPGEKRDRGLLRRLHAIGIALGADVPVAEVKSALTRQAQMHR